MDDPLQPLFNAARARPRGVYLWDLLNRITLVGIILALIGIAWMLLLPEQRKLNEMDAELKVLQTRLDKETRKTKQIEREVDLLQREHLYISAFARDHLNLHGEGETVINIKRPGESGDY